MYSINFSILINWMLPAALRKAAQVAWINALLDPLKTLHAIFESFVSSVRYDIQITGQVRVLEFHLNRLFNAGGTVANIYITDGSPGAIVFIFLESENNPVYLPQFISGTPADFIVHCHKSLKARESEIKSFLDRYKLPGKTYTITYFT